MAERAELVFDLYYDLEYSRNRGEGFTEINCLSCGEWSHRDQWGHGTSNGDKGIICPECSASETESDGVKLAVR